MIMIALFFRFKKTSRNSILRRKKYEIIAWRRQYLREIKKYKEGGNRKIYYLDETRINAGLTVIKVWSDTTVINTRQASVTALKNPSGKGNHFITLHIGSDEGWVKDGLLMFQSKKSGDYHEEMNAKVFKNWLKNILARLEENSVIVLDNASYYS